MGIEPMFSAWEADVLPLNYTRGGLILKLNTRMLAKDRPTELDAPVV